MATSFGEIKANPELRWKVKQANERGLVRIMDIEEEIQSIDREIRRLTYEVGSAVLKEIKPEPMIVVRVQALEEKKKMLCMQTVLIIDHVRAAMSEQLAQMLPADAMADIAEEDLNAFFEDLEQKTLAECSLGNMMHRILDSDSPQERKA